MKWQWLPESDATWEHVQNISVHVTQFHLKYKMNIFGVANVMNVRGAGQLAWMLTQAQSFV